MLVTFTAAGVALAIAPAYADAASAPLNGLRRLLDRLAPVGLPGGPRFR
ncbi:hypothetical protein GCM10023259_048600 [Thermocatellispora tengchongensis]